MSDFRYEDVQVGEAVGDGAFAVVHRGKYRGEEVAVKLWRHIELPKKELDLFYREVECGRVFDHPNIVKFIGASINPVCIVTEFVRGRDVWELVHDAKTEIRWRDVKKLGIQVALGMQHIHDKGQIHRDLKSLNLLASKDWDVKICDFGLSRVASYVDKMTGGRGTTQWMAPEVLMHRKYDTKADVYSYGITLWEVCAREAPYHGQKPMDVATKVCHQKYRPTIPANVPPGIVRIINACWAQDPAERPSFAEIAQMWNHPDTLPVDAEDGLVPPLRVRQQMEAAAAGASAPAK